jgi:putative transposase
VNTRILFVKLSKKQRSQLLHLTKKGKAPPRVVRRARILLLAHEGLTDPEIMTRLEISRATVRNIRLRFQTQGTNLVHEQARPGRPIKFDGTDRAKITALACSEAPEGYSQWTLRLLASKTVELGIVESIHHDTVGEMLKKMNCNLKEFDTGALAN